MSRRLILVTVCFLAASFFATVSAESLSDDSRTTTANGAQPRSLDRLAKDVWTALRDEARSRKAGDNTAEVLRLVDLYYEMAGHPRRNAIESFQQLGRHVRIRLKTVRDHIVRQIAKGGKPARKANGAAQLANIPAGRDGALAQQFGLPAAGAGGPGGLAGGGNGAIGGAGRPRDYGPDLVDLIQRTISPATWDENGGTSTIVYYAPLQVIVVRAPSEVHRQVGGVLGGLRAAGGP